MKYKLTENSIEFNNRTLFQIQALKDFGEVKAGDLGGYIEKESNLSQEGSCWLYDNVKVYGDAKVFSDVKVYGDAKVFSDVKVYGDAKVFSDVKVYGDAKVFSDVKVYGDAVYFKEKQEPSKHFNQEEKQQPTILSIIKYSIVWYLAVIMLKFIENHHISSRISFTCGILYIFFALLFFKIFDSICDAKKIILTIKKNKLPIKSRF